MASKRHAFSDHDRKRLQEHAQSHPWMKQRQLRDWFQHEYGYALSQSMISRWLLATDRVEIHQTAARYRRRNSKWPELEIALFEWYQRVELEGPVSDDLIRVNAERLWKLIPLYQSETMPEFSNGWLAGFKKRHGIRQRVRHGEATSTTTNDNRGESSDSDSSSGSNTEQTPPQQTEAAATLPPPPEITYPSYNTAHAAMQAWAKEHGYCLAINGTFRDKRTKEVTRRRFGCSQGKPQDTRKIRATGTGIRCTTSTKIGCRMQVWLYASDVKSPTGPWQVKWYQGRRSHEHNHAALPAEAFSQHRRDERQDQAVQDFIETQIEIGCTAGQILSSLVARFPDIHQTRSDITNIIKRRRRAQAVETTSADATPEAMQENRAQEQAIPVVEDTSRTMQEQRAQTQSIPSAESTSGLMQEHRAQMQSMPIGEPTPESMQQNTFYVHNETTPVNSQLDRYWITHPTHPDPNLPPYSLQQRAQPPNSSYLQESMYNCFP